MKLLRKKWIFPILILLVIVVQFLLLRVILNNGFTADDWMLLFDYKTISQNPDILEKLSSIFHTKGIYTSYQVLYIGFLESIFKGNYQAYQITNILFKALATISLYPLIVLVFKRRLLAFLTTILYAISYSSAGALQFVVKGSDYLAIFFMNICLMTYYLSFKTKGKFILWITSILLFLAFLFSPIRLYPFLILIILMEFLIWIKSRGLIGLIFALLRLALLFSPFLILSLFLPKSTGNYLDGLSVIFRFLSYGNYQLLLTPFAGLGYTFLTNDIWPVFGNVTFNNFKDYIFFLFHGSAIIYPILTVLIGFLLTKKPRFFIIGIISTNLIFELVTYFFVTNLRGVTGPNVKDFSVISTNAVFFGFFCLSVAVASLILWFKNHKSNILLLSLFAGPIFASVFLWGTWLIIGDSLNFKEGIHWYLIIPPVGSSLFISSLMVLVYDKIEKFANLRLRRFLITCLFLIILPIYLISSKEINTVFTGLLHIGYGASDQEEIKSKLLSYIKNPLDGKPKLFYLDNSEDLGTPQLFYPVTVIAGFTQKMHFRDWEIVNGCVGLIYDKVTLEKSVRVKDGIKGFTAGSLCVENYSALGNIEMFYKPENFYALKLKNKEVIDIKKSVLDELRF